MRKSARFPRLQMPQNDRPQRDAFEPKDFVIEPCEHPANLAVLALAEDDAQPHALSLRSHALDTPRSHVPFAEPDAFQEFLNVLMARLPGNLDDVGLLNTEARVHEEVGKVSVVGEEE